MTPQARPAAAGARWRLRRKVIVVVLIVLRRSRGRLGSAACTRHPDTGMETRLRGADVERKQAPHARHKEEAS